MCCHGIRNVIGEPCYSDRFPSDSVVLKCFYFDIFIQCRLQSDQDTSLNDTEKGSIEDSFVSHDCVKLTVWNHDGINAYISYSQIDLLMYQIGAYISYSQIDLLMYQIGAYISYSQIDLLMLPDWSLHQLQPNWSADVPDWSLHQLQPNWSADVPDWSLHQLQPNWSADVPDWSLHQLKPNWSADVPDWSLHQLQPNWSADVTRLELTHYIFWISYNWLFLISWCTMNCILSFVSFVLYLCRHSPLRGKLCQNFCLKWRQYVSKDYLRWHHMKFPIE